jgi:hypothetical protein
MEPRLFRGSFWEEFLLFSVFFFLFFFFLIFDLFLQGVWCFFVSLFLGVWSLEFGLLLFFVFVFVIGKKKRKKKGLGFDVVTPVADFLL